MRVPETNIIDNVAQTHQVVTNAFIEELHVLPRAPARLPR